MRIKKSKSRLNLFKILFVLSSFILFASHSYADEGDNTVLVQDVAVIGVIIDGVDNTPMVGVSITEKGTHNATMTDIDGKFTLKVKAGSTLVISFVGYKTQEVLITSETKSLSIVMNEDATMLTEVVAIGYGTSRKQDLSMAISTVEVDKILKSGPSTINSVLQGRIPGLSLQQGGGDPLADATLTIRGRGSRGSDSDLTRRSSAGVNNNASSGDGILIVVDGVPNAPYNVEDVETITVMKDAASAAIYGSKTGSGGVILITTKQGRAGKVRIDVNISNGIQYARNLPKTLRSDEYNRVWTDAVRFANDKGIPATLPSVADPEKYPYGAVTRTDWVDEIFRTGHTQHYALSVSGGSETMKSLFSFGYDRTNGIMLNTYNEKFTGKLNLGFDLTKWLNLSETLSFKYGNSQGDIGRSHVGPLIGAVFYPRSATVYEYDKDGNPVYDDYGERIYGGTIPSWAQAEVIGYGNVSNPVAQLNRMRQYRPDLDLVSTTALELKPMRGLSVKSMFTAAWNPSRYEGFWANSPEFGDPQGATGGNKRFIASSWNNRWLWENIATYAIEIADKHNISAMAGSSMEDERERWNDAWAQGFTSEKDEHTNLDDGKVEDKFTPSETRWEERSVGFFGRIGYSFDDRYFLTGSLRYDATSKLKNNRSGTFPAVSGSWKLSSEPFFKSMNLDFVDLIKIRGGWGQVGNKNLIPRGSFLNRYESDDSYIIYGKDQSVEVKGSSMVMMANLDLKWEITEQIGGGIDLSLLNNSLDITVDYFYKTTKDLIEKMPNSPSFPMKYSSYGNIGKVVNKGWDVNVAYKNKIDKVGFNVFGNLSYVDSKVKNLGELDAILHEDGINSFKPLRSAPGQPWYSFYMKKVEGVFQSQEEIDAYRFKDPVTGEARIIQPNAKPGDFRFADTNNDGKINDDDKQFLGSYQPDLTYAFGGGLDYKGFDFSFMFQGSAGNKIYNGFKQMGLSGRMQQNNMLNSILNSWEYDPTSGYPRLGIASGDASGAENYGMNSFFLESGTYLRLKNLTLGYTVPVKFMTKIGLPTNTLRFYTSAENVFTITPYSGIDPEVGYFGLDGSNYPIATTVMFGLNFNF